MAELTVLMPVYNAGKYIKDAIDSILMQTFTDFEFLIIDDGSTDKSIDIIKSYDDKRIRLVCNDENMGISKTLNRGIDLTNTDLIARMDADDISMPDRLIKQHQFMVNNPDIKLLATQFERISDTGKMMSRPTYDFYPMYFQLVFHCFGICHPSVMYRKDAVTDVGMYPETHSEDFRLWSKLIRKYRFFHMNEVLIKYRLSEQSISHTTHREAYKEVELIYAKDNLEYFMGDKYTIPDSWLNAYRNDMQPIMERPDINEMVRCIKELDKIALKVIEKENVNRDQENIRNAVNRKKKQLLEGLLRELPVYHGLQLLLKTGYYSRSVSYTVPNSIKNAVKSRFNIRKN